MKLPLQPIYRDENGRARFRGNKIVRWMLDQSALGRTFDLNTIATQDFPQADYVQFMQLIGYSVGGFHELSGVPDKACLAASEEARRLGLEPGGCRDEGCEIHVGVEESPESRPYRHGPSPAAGPWVSVEERLPTAPCTFLVWCSDSDNGAGIWCCDDEPHVLSAFKESGITHWAMVVSPEAPGPPS